MTATAASSDARRSRTFVVGLAALAVAAFVLRVVLVLTVGERNPDGGDPLYYHLQANLLANGDGFAEPFTWQESGRIIPSAIHPPLFSVLLAIPSLVGLDGFVAHKITSAVAGVGAVVVIGLVARRLAGPRAGLLAAGIAAVAPNLWVIEGILMPESLYALTIAVVLLAAYRFVDGPTVARAAVLGATIGIAALARGEAAALVVLLGVPLAWRARSWKSLVALGAAAALVVAPWTVRNLVQFDQPVLLSANGDEVLGNANCDRTWYGEQTGFWSLECYAPNPPDGDESVRAKFYRDAGLEYVGDHLGRAPVVAAARLGRVWDVWRPGQNVELNTVEGRRLGVARAGQAVYWMLLPLAAVALVALRRRGETVWPLVAMAVLVTITAVYAYGITRFRIPAEVAIIVLAGVALDAGLRRLRPAR